MSDPKYGSFSEYQESREGGAVTEEAVRGYIVGKAAQDDAFRKALLADPFSVVQNEVGIQLPAGLKLTVHEETNDELHMVLSAPVQLTAAQLESVSGGWPYPDPQPADDAFNDADGGVDYDH